MPSLETLMWTLLLVVVLPIAAMAGSFLVRRIAGAEVLARHNDVAGFIYAVVGVLYAVLLGFTAIIVWEQFQRAQEVAELEANEVADLYRDSRVFPAEVRDRLAAQLREYARLVVEEEWPAMVEGRPSPETWAAYEALWRTYHEFRPADEHERLWYEESVGRLNQLGDQRRDRLLSGGAEVPAIMWAVLLGAGAVTIAFSFLFGSPNPRGQALMTGALALTIGVVLLSIVALDHPFRGMARVGPEALEQVQMIFDQAGPGSSP